MRAGRPVDIRAGDAKESAELGGSPSHLSSEDTGRVNIAKDPGWYMGGCQNYGPFWVP